MVIESVVAQELKIPESKKLKLEDISVFISSGQPSVVLRRNDLVFSAEHRTPSYILDFTKSFLPLRREGW